MKFRNQGCHSSYAEVELGGYEKEGFIEAEQCCWRSRIVGISQKMNGHHLRDGDGTTKWTDTDNHKHEMPLLWPWRLDSVYCNCSCSSCQLSLCTFLFVITHTGEQLFNGSVGRSERKLTVSVQPWWHSTVKTHVFKRQGTNQTSLHTAN